MAGKFLAFQMEVPFGDYLLPVPSCIVSQDANRHPIVYSGLSLQAGQDDRVLQTTFRVISWNPSRRIKDPLFEGEAVCTELSQSWMSSGEISGSP